MTPPFVQSPAWVVELEPALPVFNQSLLSLRVKNPVEP